MNITIKIHLAPIPGVSNPSCRRLWAAGLLLLASVAMVIPSGASVWSWSGAGANTYWNNSANWGYAGVPGNGDTVIFPANQPNLINTNNLTGLVLNQIRFAGPGGGYDIRGNTFTVTNSIMATNTAGANIIENTIVLATTPNLLIAVSNGVQLTLDGNLTSGVSAGVIKAGLGTLVYQGPEDNTYPGTTLVSGGTLQFNVGGANASGGPLVIGDGTGTGNPTVQNLQPIEMGNSEPITINAGGTWDLNNFSDQAGPNLTLNGGTIETEGGALMLVANSTVTAGAGSSAITGNLSVGSGVCTFAVAGNLAIGATISGSATIDKSGGGTLTFSGGNTYSGLTVVQQGILLAENNLALGATTSGTVVSNTATLELAGSITIANEALSLNGPGIDSSWGALDVENGVNTWAGPITVNANSTLDSWNAGAELHLSGAISGAGGLELFNGGTGGGTHFFDGSAANSYAGTTTVDSGALLELNKPALFYSTIPGNSIINGTVRQLTGYQLPFWAAVTVNDGGLLDLNGYTAYVGPLNGTANSSLALGAGYLYANWGYTGTSTFGGLISGTGGTLDMQGTGTFILSHANTYTGLTRVSQGTVLVNGYQPQCPTYVDTRGTLGGSGTVGAVTLNGSTINTGANQLQIVGDMTTLGSTNTAMIEGAILFGNGLRTITVNRGAAPGGYDVEITAAIADAGSGFQIVSGANGDLQLMGTNTFSGPLTVGSGTTVAAETPWALGTTNGGTYVASGGNFWIYGTGITNETLTLAAGATFYGQAGLQNPTWAGPVTLLGDAAIQGYNFFGLLNIQGPITGTGNLDVESDGETVEFSGALANTYSGTTTLELGFGAIQGTLVLDKTGLGNAIPNSLTIGSDCVVELDNFWQIYSTNKSVTLAPSSQFDLNGYSDWVGPISIQGAQINTGGGTLYMSGDITVIPSATAQSFITGVGSILDDVITITNTGEIFSPDLVISANLGGGGSTNGIIKAGPGEVALSGNNSFTGPVTINGGSLWAETSTALGVTNAPATVNYGGTLILTGTGLDFGLKPLSLSGAGYTNGALVSAGSSSWEGNVTLPGLDNCTIYNSTNSLLTLAGAISGPGGFIKAGPGTNVLAGTTDNPYGGTSIINDGVLKLMKTASAYAIGYGGMTIGDGLGAAGSAVVRSYGNYEILEVSLVVNADGLLDLNGNSDLLTAYVTLNDANIQNTSAGTLTLDSDTLLTVNPGVSYISGNLYLEADSYWTNTGALVMDASVVGPANIYKSGAGSAYLSASNSFTGLMVVQQGFVYAQNNWALGATNSGTIVSNTASLVLDNVAITNESLALNGPGVSSEWGALDVETGTNIWAGPITLYTNCTMDAWNPGSALHLNGQIGGPGSLEVFGDSTGGGTHYIEGVATNSYRGLTTVDAGATLVLNDSTAFGAVPSSAVVSGTLRLAKSFQMSSGAALWVNAGGLFDLGSYAQDLDVLYGSGAVTFGAGSFLEIGVLGGSSEFDGVMSGPGSAGGLTLGKLGGGTFTLTGNNTYQNQTVVSGGTLVVNGRQPQSPIDIYAGGVLRGTGIVGLVTNYGTVYPGTSLGILNSSNVLFEAASAFRVDLAGPAPGTGYDQLNATGSVSLAGANLQLHMSFLSVTNSQFTIINNDAADAIAGTFLGLPEGAIVVADNGAHFKISYQGGTGNDVVLTEVGLPPRPTVSNITNLGAGGVQINGTGFTNLAYSVQATTDLTSGSWVYVGTAVANSLGQLQFTDPGSTNYPIRFYRFSWP